MKKYIRCCYCGEILGELKEDEEIPTSAYHTDCLKEAKERKDWDKEWNELVAPYE